PSSTAARGEGKVSLVFDDPPIAYSLPSASPTATETRGEAMDARGAQCWVSGSYSSTVLTGEEFCPPPMEKSLPPTEARPVRNRGVDSGGRMIQRSFKGSYSASSPISERAYILLLRDATVYRV